jgi:hypothetical protein
VADSGAGVHDAVVTALAEDPGAVVCDLSGIDGLLGTESVEQLASIGAAVRDWPGTPVAVVCPDAGLRGRLRQHRDGQHLLVAGSLLPALSLLSGHQQPDEARVSLDPVAQSASAARELVVSTCAEWGLAHHGETAALVVSEAVTNAILHSATDLEVAIARHGSRLRVAVRDSIAGRPCARAQDLTATGGRGMHLVAACALAWGVLPTEGSGKVVWAVLDAPPVDAPAE